MHGKNDFVEESKNLADIQSWK